MTRFVNWSASVFLVLGVAGCSGGTAAPVVVPAAAMVSYDEEMARIRTALPERNTCEDVDKSDPANGAVEKHYYCLSPGKSFASNLLFLSTDSGAITKLYVNRRGGYPDSDVALEDLIKLAAAYGFSKADFDMCTSEEKHSVEHPTFSVICEVLGSGVVDYSLTINPKR